MIEIIQFLSLFSKWRLWKFYIIILRIVVLYNMQAYEYVCACICKHILRIPWKIIRKLKTANVILKKSCWLLQEADSWQGEHYQNIKIKNKLLKEGNEHLCKFGYYLKISKDWFKKRERLKNNNFNMNWCEEWKSGPWLHSQKSDRGIFIILLHIGIIKLYFLIPENNTNSNHNTLLALPAQQTTILLSTKYLFYNIKTSRIQLVSCSFP